MESQAKHESIQVGLIGHPSRHQLLIEEVLVASCVQQAGLLSEHARTLDLLCCRVLLPAIGLASVKHLEIAASVVKLYLGPQIQARAIHLGQEQVAKQPLITESWIVGE